MHFAIDLYILHYSQFVGFQTTVEIVKIVHPTDFSCGSIEEFRGNCLG